MGLDTDHRAAQARIQGGTQTLTGRSAPFRRIAYRTDRDLPPRPMRVFRLLDHGGASRSFWTIQTRELAAMLRHQAHQAAKTAEWNLQTVEGYVCGHGNNGQPPPINRLSYLPLPSIGHRHTDGLIRRIALAESPNGNGEHLHELANRLVGARLTREGDQRAMAVIAQPDVSDRVIQRYRRESTVWASVTPVVLPGFNGRGKTNQSILRITPDTGESELSGRDLKTHKLVLRCLAEAEIPAHLVAEVWLQKLPLWPNLPRAEKPPRPAYLRHRPTFHVRLRFKHAVHGPITLGAGRFTGLGTFAALREGDR